MISINSHKVLAITFIGLLLQTTSLEVFSHGGSQLDSSISASATFSLRSDSPVDNGEFWRIPGVMMGGESEPVEKGFSLDDISLSGVWKANGQTFVHTELASHAGHEELTLENFWIQYFLEIQNIQLSAGKMDAKFSPTVSWHSKQSHFSDAPLISDVFFGRSFIDNGIRTTLNKEKIQAGVEIWNGDSWPASPGEYSSDLFIHYLSKKDKLEVIAGLWGMYSEAELRADQRYSGAHSHNTLSDDPPDVRFTGRSISNGAFVKISAPLTTSFKAGLYTELMIQQSHGSIIDQSRQAELETNNQGFIVEAFINRYQHTWAIRHEVLSFDNMIDGNSPQFIAADANLINEGFEPERITGSWQWQVSEDFTLRSEIVHDHSLPVNTDRASIGLIWTDKIWQKQGKKKSG